MPRHHWTRSLGGALLCLALSTLPIRGEAAARAWLINADGDALKLDLSQGAIVGTGTLPLDRFGIPNMWLDAVRGNLFVPYGRQAPSPVGVVDLKTLSLKGDLDFTVDDPPPTAGHEAILAFVFPPSGREFYVRWWNPAGAGGAGAFEVATVDTPTLRKTAGQVTSPALADRLMLDAAGRRLYSMTLDLPARVDVFDVPSFSLTSTIDLQSFLSPAAFGRSIHDFALGKILINENEKALRTDPNRFTLFVLDVASGRITPKIRTGFSGNARLLPRTNRMLFDEVSVLTPGAVMALSGRDFVHPGKLHVYDISTGNRLATVTIADVQMSAILGVNSAEDTAYYYASSGGPGGAKLSIISLTSYSVVKELPLSPHEWRMFFFDE